MGWVARYDERRKEDEEMIERAREEINFLVHQLPLTNQSELEGCTYQISIGS